MADQTLATTNIGDNVRVLREKTDETNVRISTMAQELEALRQTIASQPPPQAGAGRPRRPIRRRRRPPARRRRRRRRRPSRRVRHRSGCTRRAYDDYTAGRYDLAIQGFQGFVQAFPRLPQAAGAMYNIGMSYYNQSKWAEARDAFLKVINDYPQAQGTTLPDAYYKLGQVVRAAEPDRQREESVRGGRPEIPRPPVHPLQSGAAALADRR